MCLQPARVRAMAGLCPYRSRFAPSHHCGCRNHSGLAAQLKRTLRPGHKGNHHCRCRPSGGTHCGLWVALTCREPSVLRRAGASRWDRVGSGCRASLADWPRDWIGAAIAMGASIESRPVTSALVISAQCRRYERCWRAGVLRLMPHVSGCYGAGSAGRSANSWHA